jgi:hypothetical protein
MIHLIGVAVAAAVLGAGCVTVTLSDPPGETDALATPAVDSTPVLAATPPSSLSTDSSVEPVPSDPSASPPSPTGAPTATATTIATPTATISSEGACGDPAYELSGFQWGESFRWRFQESSTPDYLEPSAVLNVLKSSMANITSARNDCNLPDKVQIVSAYLGSTDEPACQHFATTDENIISFADLPPRESDLLAYACPYGEGSDVLKVDIVISTDVVWALDVEDCVIGEELLEAVMTHELGHAFGLDHVNERQHGDLTMSPRANGFCDAEEISLGLGDVLGLEELYGTD